MDIELLKILKRKENLEILRNEINFNWVSVKIKNHLLRNPYLNLTVEEVKNKIMNDDLIGSFYIKDPSKQNISENVIGEFIYKIDGVNDFINHPSNVNLFILDGKITNKREDGIKSIDYSWTFKNKKIYATQKYTNEPGGAQDHQFNEVIQFLKHSSLNEDDFFIAIVDGNYYTDEKISILKKYETKNVKVCNFLEIKRVMYEHIKN